MMPAIAVTVAGMARANYAGGPAPRPLHDGRHGIIAFPFTSADTRGQPPVPARDMPGPIARPDA